MQTVLDRYDVDRVAKAAELARTAPDIVVPELRYFNSQPCFTHSQTQTIPVTGCRQCGIALRRHQRTALVWLFLHKKSLLADSTGTGKTLITASLIALLKQVGEISPPVVGGKAPARVLIVARAAAINQWHQELARALPGVLVATAQGNAASRAQVWSRPWEVMVCSPQMLLRDGEHARRAGVHLLVADDCDALRHGSTQTARILRTLAHSAPRVVIANATPLQKKLEELYDVLLAVGGRDVLGSKAAFQRRYVVNQPVTIFARGGRKLRTTQTTGYKEISEFSSLIAPMVLRRTVNDLDDVAMPALQVDNVYLDLYRAQETEYVNLQQGALRILRQAKPTDPVQQVTAINTFLYGSKICAGLSTLGPDRADVSVKFDWLVDKITGDWSDPSEQSPHGDKVVVFCQFRAGVATIAQRLAQEGVGTVTFTGDDNNPNRRQAAITAFDTDPQVRVLVGTSALESSLNLQVANHMVCVDQIPNPARMTQLVGRIRRDGSRHHTVFCHNLLANDTQDERIVALLEQEAAISNVVWNETSELFAQLSPTQLLSLIISP